jgi:hypothetical protein
MPSCSHEEGKQTGFIRFSLGCHNKKQGGAWDKISIYIYNMNVSTIITIKGTIRKI